MESRVALLLVTGAVIAAAAPSYAARPKPADTKAATAAAKPGGKGAATSGKDASATLDSLGVLEHAVAKDSSNFDNLYHLGVMYLDRERIPEATRVFERALKVRPKDLKAMVNLGAAYDAAGNPGGAQSSYRKALEMAPGDSVASCRLASSLYAQQKYQEAVDILRKVIADKPRSHCAYFTLGVAFADAGLYRDAIRMWQKVVELAPDSPEAISARESIDVLSKYLTGQTQ